MSAVLVSYRRVLLVVALAAAGAGFLGHGAYIHAKAQLAQLLLHSAWQRTLQGEVNVKPWPWADMWPVARLRAPAHGVDAIVLAGDSGRVLAFGPGANFGFARPGAAGVSLISAHRDTHFRFLRDVHPDDEIEIQDAYGAWSRYRVVETRIVDARHARLDLPATGSGVVLVTCYPFDDAVPGGALRYVVTALPVTPRLPL